MDSMMVWFMRPTASTSERARSSSVASVFDVDVPAMRDDDPMTAPRNVLDEEQLRELVAHPEPVPPKTVVITFDDGYEDNLLNADPVLDYANAMVARSSGDPDDWQEHVDGKLNYAPPILPKAPAKIAVSLWLTDGRNPNPNCVRFADSSQLAKAGYVQTVQPNGAGVTPGFLGYMFWAAECPSSRNVCTTPPDSCENGMGAAATHFNIPLPLDFSNLRPD